MVRNLDNRPTITAPVSVDQEQLLSIINIIQGQVSVDKTVLDARNILSSFNEYIGGEINNKHHIDLCNALDSGEDVIGTLPRNSAKSTIGSIRYPAYSLGKDRGMRIIICSCTATLSESFSRSIGALLSNDKYRLLFGDLIPISKSAIWNTQEKIVAGRPEYNHFGLRVDEKDASVFSVGVGGSVVGRRADLIILDDIIDRRTVKTQSQIEDIKQWLTEELKGVRHAQTQTVLLGTRWNDKDIYIDNISQALSSNATVLGNMEEDLLEQVRRFNTQ